PATGARTSRSSPRRWPTARTSRSASAIGTERALRRVACGRSAARPKFEEMADAARPITLFLCGDVMIGDVCTLANNHVLDFDEEGLLDTLDALDAVGIGRCGAGRDLDEARAPARIQLSGGRELCVFGAGHASSGIPVAWAAGASRGSCISRAWPRMVAS